MCNRLTKKEYKNLNYMVQLNPDEIIDSTSKGNVTRFINHSCDPNSVGEKWHVLGQSRIGFFSTRPIRKGEEITFDYSFQVFGDGAQICYCGSSKCRGYINKSSQIVDHNSSEDSESANDNTSISKLEEKKNLEKRTANNDENKLRELRRQLTDIAKLKTGLKADQEMATLNLNRLMVHITDSVSRLHVLTFIQEHDMNKRLFMDFSGLSIIHNWMTSNENESFKLMILEILAELPITNRNTITKSKVLDVVAEWAEIPQDIKTKIESLEYPATEIKNHCQEIDRFLPNDNEMINSLVKKSRALWKKWIVLKMVFRIPKKIDQHKRITEINSSKVIDDCYQSSLNITTFNRNTFRHSKKYIKKVRNQRTIFLDRTQLRKENRFKVDQERQKMFKKKVMDDWYEKNERVVNKNLDENYLQHSQILNFHNCNNLTFNNNNGISEQTRWDFSSQATHIDQNSIINYNVTNSSLNYIPPQALQQSLIQFPQYSYVQSQALSNYHLVNQPIFSNTHPPQTSSQPSIKQLQNITLLNNKPVHQNIESPNMSPTKNLIKLAETNVFNLINDSLRKHYNPDKNKVVNSEIEHSKKPCIRAVQSGADLLARIKVISNSFKNQPSKLITVKNLKQKNSNTKIEKIPSSEIKLKTICDKNNRIVFINEETNMTSKTLSEDLVPIPEKIKISKENKFANAIFNSLLKKVLVPDYENSVPKTFVSKTLDSNIITYHETDKEIELYNNMKPKVLKKTVGHIKTKNGFAPVLKRQWGIKLKGLKRNRNEIPATKRNIMRKGSIHRSALKNCLVNITKSALKRQSSINVDDYLKRPKEKRVTFWIEGETSPNLSHSEVRPINLNQNTVKQKPLMKCHPFEIRNEPKSIFQPSTSDIQNGDNLQIPGLDSTNDQIIPPIVAKFKASRNRRIHLRDKSIELDQLRSQRKHKIPISMMSLSVDVLKLIPDNRKEMKKVIDYYHSMATVIVKTLGSYAKKTCQQGRIRSDEDFKYLAKKINENVLLKELQLKKVDKLKISDSTKDKVAEYIRKYMSRFGEVYKRKPNEQINHKSK
uniref:[histone H3]-lysine(36) N-trimethyltransferase n=2 Tax=Melanaphis sacchari TaxID=742174 RepID=A0A2H8TWC6_9HEMI